MYYVMLSTLLLIAVVEIAAIRLIVGGDFNRHGIDRRLSEKLDDVLAVSSGLQQHVQQATRGGNLLDIIAVSIPAIINYIRVVDSAVSNRVGSQPRRHDPAQSRHPLPPDVKFTSQAIQQHRV